MPYGGKGRARGRFARAGLGLLTALALLGCKGESTHGDDDDDNGDGNTHVASGTPVAAQGFGQKFADAYCGAIGPCCAREKYAFTESTCVEAAKALLDAAVAEYTSYPGVVFDEAAAGDCIELYRAAATACTDHTLLDGDNACQEIFRGTVPEGGHCSENVECAEIAGASYVECDAGVCTRPSVENTTPSDVHAKLGQPCNMSCEKELNGWSCSGGPASPTTNQACWKEDGLICTGAGVCVALPEIGAACPDYECRTDAYCNPNTRVCTAAVASGPCPSYDGCVSTSYCDSDTQMCIPLKANGGVCNSSTECQSGNCDGDVCREWSVASTESCAGRLDH